MILTYFNANLNSDLQESLIDQSVLDKNTEYINTHKSFVKKSYQYLVENCPEILDGIDIDQLNSLIDEHDMSKFSTEEFEPYAQKWFGDGKKTAEYEQAWEHHWKSNPHHPEYWAGEDMPKIYIIEMLCDWLSFGLKTDNPSELIEYYETKAKDDPEKNFSEKTKNQIEEYLEIIKDKIAKD